MASTSLPAQPPISRAQETHVARVKDFRANLKYHLSKTDHGPNFPLPVGISGFEYWYFYHEAWGRFYIDVVARMARDFWLPFSNDNNLILSEAQRVYPTINIDHLLRSRLPLSAFGWWNSLGETFRYDYDVIEFGEMKERVQSDSVSPEDRTSHRLLRGYTGLFDLVDKSVAMTPSLLANVFLESRSQIKHRHGADVDWSTETQELDELWRYAYGETMTQTAMREGGPAPPPGWSQQALDPPGGLLWFFRPVRELN